MFSKFYCISQVISFPKILIRQHFHTFQPNDQSKGKLANWVDPDEMLQYAESHQGHTDLYHKSHINPYPITVLCP